jgi:hypothetical protein
MKPSKPIFCLRQARASDDGYVYFATVKTLPRYSVGVERVPAAEILKYAARGVRLRKAPHSKTRSFGLVGYLDGLRRHFGGVLWLLDDPEERDALLGELRACRAENEKRIELARQGGHLQ